MVNNMNFKRLLLFIGVICFLILPSSIFAATVNGITVNKKTRLSTGYDIEFFTNFSLSTKWGTITGNAGKYVYNESGSSTVNDGWIAISGITGSKEIMILYGTATGIGTASFRIEGRTGTNAGSAATISTRIYTGTGTEIYTVAPYLDEIRVGYNILTIGTDTVDVIGSFLGTTENL